MSLNDHPRLRMYWSKAENSLMVAWDPGCSAASGRYMMGVLTKEVLSELDARGYDTTTIRFQIRKKETNASE